MLKRLAKINSALGQGGYLYEIPIIVIIFAVVTLILGNILPPPWNKILYILLAVSVIFFLIYNFILNRRGNQK